METTNASNEKDLALKPATASAVMEELSSMEKKKESDPELEAKTTQLAEELLSANLDELSKKRYVNEMGMKYQTALAHHSKILDQSIRTLSHSQDGSKVADSLLDLRKQVEEINPKHYDLKSPSGSGARFFRNLLGKKNSVSRYLEKYEASSAVIADIIKSLEAGRQQLIDDNKTLDIDKQQMRNSLDGLTRAQAVGESLYQKLEEKARLMEVDSEERRFVEEELLFALNQRIIDIQTALAVNQQGVISYDMLMRNNRELITGINRTITITASALRVAVTTRLALNNQKKVLDAKKKVDQTTADLIEDNAKVLRHQGVEIQKQAASSTLDVEKLTSAFNTLNQAMDEISNFRRESIPLMRQQVVKFQQLTNQAAATIDRMERGNAVKETVLIDISDDLSKS
ncbi:toxic anion resistance protein [Catalinimonas niigatensis]|uniref:toxic anion resistance protein n=1 Tax=Catalinimonas niigatensis TaxID=1397264 RepID=UPI00266676D8|nr:toxic anion resistance protein [Catalinimonas niigatensis]WPP49159.1 toxic anion resistance protein [Catalinimonas niigatensis]